MTFQLENVRFTNFKIFKNSRIFANFETWNEFYSFIHYFFIFALCKLSHTSASAKCHVI